MGTLLDALTGGQRRARLRSAVIGLALLVVAAAGWEAWRRTQRARTVAACEQAGATIAAVWPGEGSAARIAMREAVLGTRLTYAGATVERIEPWLDQYADAWRDARTSSCSLHEVEHAWSDAIGARAAECFGERSEEFAALVGELTRADAGVVQNAVTATAVMPRVEPCADPAVLGRRPERPRDLSEDVVRIRTALSQANALLLVGKPKDGVAAAEGALDEAKLLGWGPLSAEAHTVLGIAFEDSGKWDEAKREFVAAYLTARRSAVTEVAATAAARLVLIVGDRLERPDEGLLWAELAEVELAGIEGSEEDLVAARRLQGLGAIWRTKGDAELAKSLFERSLQIRERRLGSEHPQLAANLDNLAIVARDQGAFAESIKLSEHALAIRERALGPDHPDVASTLGEMSWNYYELGNLVEATRLGERALALREQALGQGHPDVALSLNNLAAIELANRAYDKARALYERSLAIRETELDDPNHSEVAQSLLNLATVIRTAGDPAAAKPLHERALAIYEESRGREHENFAVALFELGSDLHALGEHVEARALHERGLAILEKKLGPEHPAIAEALLTMANLREELADYAEAKAQNERALVIIEKARPADHPQLAVALTSLARVTMRLGDAGAAAPLLERALAIQEGREEAASVLAQTRFALARALWDSGGDRSRAIALADAAAVGWRTASSHAKELDEVEAWLASRR